MPPTYRQRLRLEGGLLALLGLAGSAVLLLAVEEASRGPQSTAVQVAVVGLLLAVLGPRGVLKAVEKAEDVRPDEVGSGEPTPLWHVVTVVAVLTAGFGLLAGWDAGLRITLGCALVGLAQAVLLERVVAHAERRTGRTYFRAPGARIGRGTPLRAVA